MKIFIFLSLLTMTSVLHAQTVEQEITTLETQLKTLEGVIDRTPYKEEQHVAIESYFKKLNDLALNITDYSNTSKAYNKYTQRYGVEAFCKKTFLDKKRWSDLISNCTKNGFFLCAEEARAFPTIKKSLKDSLREDLKKNFEASKICNVL